MIGKLIFGAAATIVIFALLIAANGGNPLVRELVMDRAAECGDWEALTSLQFWKGLGGYEPESIGELTNACRLRGMIEAAPRQPTSPAVSAPPAPATPRAPCWTGWHAEGTGCVPDGQHAVGGGRTCPNGWHDGGGEKCVPDGSHAVGNGRTCPGGTNWDGGDNCLKPEKRPIEGTRHCDAGIPPKDCDLTPEQAKAKVEAWMNSPAGKEAVRVAREATDEREKPSICGYDAQRQWVCQSIDEWINQGAAEWQP